MMLETQPKAKDLNEMGFIQIMCQANSSLIAAKRAARAIHEEGLSSTHLQVVENEHQKVWDQILLLQAKYTTLLESKVNT